MHSPSPMRHTREGVSLIEIVFVVGIFSVIGALVTPMFLSVSEERALQHQSSAVEKNAGDILHVLDYQIRHAERVLFPASAANANVLMLQTSNPSLDPIVIGRAGNALQIVTRTTVRPVHSDQVLMTSFAVRNASVSPQSQGVSVTFTLQYAHSPFRDRPPYERNFQAFFLISPADTTKGNPCGCAAPSCTGGQFDWNLCTSLTNCGPGPDVAIDC